MAEIYKNDVDYMKLLFENDNISVYELDAIHLGENPSGMNIDQECAEKSLPSFADQPLYCVIDNMWNPLDSEHNDFLEHFREEYPDRITRDRILPFGCVPESAIKDAKFVDRDGKTYLRMNVVVWKKLLPHVSEILQRRDGSVKISVEFIIKDADQDPETGILNVKEFQITAITALGENFKEIMDGARLKTVKFSYNDVLKNTEKDYFCFSSQNSYVVPDDVLNTIKNGVNLRNKCGRGGTKAIYNSIKAISNVGNIYDSQIEDFKKYFSSIDEIPNEANPPTSKYIVYNMFGGNAGKEWINSIVCNGNANAINKNDEGGNKVGKIVIDNSKESAVNSSSWSDPGKSLYEPILESENADSVIHEAYLVVEDGYKDSPSEKLKYPHHHVKDGKLVLDVAGVKAAFQRASQQGIVEGSVKAHLEKHYKELGLETENFAKKFSELEDSVKEKEEQFAKMSEDFNAKCSEFDSLKTEKESMDSKCAEMQNSIDSLNAELKEKNDKLSEYEKKENQAKNMAMLDKFKECFDDGELEEFAKMAKELPCDEMNSKMSEKLMSFAENYCAKHRSPTEKFAFSVNDMFNINDYYNQFNTPAKQETDLDKIVKKSKTKVI